MSSLAEDWSDTIDDAVKNSNIFVLTIGTLTLPNGATTPMAGTSKATNISTQKNILTEGIKSAFKVVETLTESIRQFWEINKNNKDFDISEVTKKLEEFDPNATLAYYIALAVKTYLNTSISSDLMGQINLSGAQGSGAKYINTDLSI